MVVSGSHLFSGNAGNATDPHPFFSGNQKSNHFHILPERFGCSNGYMGMSGCPWFPRRCPAFSACRNGNLWRPSSRGKLPNYQNLTPWVRHPRRGRTSWQENIHKDVMALSYCFEWRNMNEQVSIDVIYVYNICLFMSLLCRCCCFSCWWIKQTAIVPNDGMKDSDGSLWMVWEVVIDGIHWLGHPLVHCCS